MHFLMDPADLAKALPSGARAIPAERAADLHPSLRGVAGPQSEFAAWSPSRLCLFYFGRVAAGGVRIAEDELRKAPMLALWTVAVEDADGRRRDVALEVFTNNGRLERPGRMAGLDVEKVRTTVGPAPEDLDGNPSPDDRYTVRIGKTMLQWEGRAAGDTTPVQEPIVTPWQAEGRNGSWVSGSLTLMPRLTGSMIGSLKVVGKGDLAEMLMRSPTRFIGPGYMGGNATFAIGR